MAPGLAILAVIGAGAVLALQAPLNAGLGAATGRLPAALVSFTVGGSALFLVLAVSGELGGVGGVTDVEVHYLLGGLVGACFVLTALTVVRVIGAGAVVGATIAGQLSAGIVIDHFGWLGLDEVAISPGRVAGVALLFAGVYLVAGGRLRRAVPPVPRDSAT